MVTGAVVFGLLISAWVAYIAERGEKLKALALWWGSLIVLAFIVFSIARGMDEEHIDLIIPSTTVPVPPTTTHK